MPSLIPLESVFPPWKEICAKYDAMCAALPNQYPSRVDADRKEESLDWEQMGLETLITLLINLKTPFATGCESIGKVIKTLDGKDKEVDFCISINNVELYFGVTSFSDSEKDFAKDVAHVDISITGVKRRDETISDTAKITSIRPHETYINRRLAVRVAREGKHRLASDYIYIAFPKIAPGFGKGLDAISRDFSFDGTDYTYPENGITGLIVVGEYLNIQPKRKSIERDIWLFKAKAFPHASETARDLLSQIDGITMDMRPKFQGVRSLLAARHLGR